MSYFKPDTDPRLFACGCARPECDAPPPDDRLVMTLELMRQYYGRAIHVTSGPRCRFRNEQEHGERDSAHLSGEAADLTCVYGPDRWDLIQAALQAGVRRVGIGKTFLHVDVARDKPQHVLWHYYPA